MNRHEILGRQVEFLDYVKGPYLSEREGQCASTQLLAEFDRLYWISHKLEYALLEHLGYGPVMDIEHHLNHGMDMCLEYFFTDWWKDPALQSAQYMDKSRSDRELRWNGPLYFAFLFAGLTGRWDDLIKISSWFDESVQKEFLAEERLAGDEDLLLLLCMILRLQPNPPDLGEPLKRLRAVRPKSLKLLFAAWEAAYGTDQATFDKAFSASVKRHVTHDMDDGTSNARGWLAVFQSIIWFIAERNGLRFPQLPEQLDAAVLRRETIGLGA